MYIFVLENQITKSGMTIKVEAKLEINYDNCNLKSLTKSFLMSLSSLFAFFVGQVLINYYRELLKSSKLNEILGAKQIIQKSHSRLTKFKTLFGDIWIPQIQVKADGKQRSITRLLLEVEPRLQIPFFMKEMLAFVGSLTTYRVGEKLVTVLSGFRCSLMSLWRSVQQIGSQLKLKEVKNGINEYEADGTGIPTLNTGKRGSELKTMFQRDEKGKLHLVGIIIGKYKSLSDWAKVLTQPLMSGIEKYGKVVLASDCDSSITQTAKKIDSNVFLQVDLWHVFHQLKYYLRLDKVEKKVKNNLISLVYKILLIKTMFSITKRLSIVGFIINSLKKNNYLHTATYLETCLENFYTYENQGNKNKYTSKTERSMRTVNMRINVGVWSDTGALNVSRIRLSHYYNGESVFSWEN